MGSTVIEELLHLLARQTQAVAILEGRLRALEIVAGAADDPRFAHALVLTLDQVETASGQLAALELSRSLVLASAGMSPDLTGTELVARFDGAEEAGRLGMAIDGLRVATERLSDARARASRLVGRIAQDVRARVEAAVVSGEL